MSFAAFIGYALILILIATSLGLWLGRRFVSSVVWGRRLGWLMLLAATVWFALAWQARLYADAGSVGWGCAEWFAHTGKWWSLLFGFCVGNGLVFGGKLLPTGRRIRLAYFMAVAVVCLLAGMRIAPVYVLLGNGHRDAAGYVIQSKDFEYACGAVALLNWLERYHGATNLTERELARECGVTVEGSTTTGILRAARARGLSNAVARIVAPQELPRLRLPAVVNISTLPQVHHATLLIEAGAGRCVFIDPAYGRWETSESRFLQIWYGHTIMLE